MIGSLRHQLPVYSPLPAAATFPALATALGSGEDPRLALAEELRTEYAADVVVLCGSGTQALRLALERTLRGKGTGTGVALPAFSCYDVAAAAVAARAPILFYDLDPRTLGPEPESLERALRDGAGVVVAAPLYGMPLAWETISALCAAYGAVLVEDAAQGHGARWRGRPLGSLADVSVLSFGRGKGWTGGRGGALLMRGVSSPALSGDDRRLPADGSVELSTVVVSAAQAVVGRPAVYRVPMSLPWLRLGETVYRDAPEPAEIPRAAAALLRRTRGLATREAVVRRRHADLLRARLAHREGLEPIVPEPEGDPGYLRFPLRAARGLAGFSDPAAAMRLGVAASYPMPLPALPQLRDRRASRGPWPGAVELTQSLMTLPTHSLVSEAERVSLLHLLDNYGAQP